MNGQQICRLMRKHNKTIKGLAQFMNVSQKRVRFVRLNGLRDMVFVRDWIEAIIA